jgi:hypothetical protein
MSDLTTFLGRHFFSSAIAITNKHIEKAKGLIDNLEVFLLGKTRLIKELYHDVRSIEGLNNFRSIERFVVFYMNSLSDENIKLTDENATSVSSLVRGVGLNFAILIALSGIVASRVLISIVSHYPSLDLRITKYEKDGYYILVSFSSLDAIDLPLADESLPVHERRSIMVVPDGEKPKLAGVATYTMTKALELFKFPPNHPITNAAYAMVDVYPHHYVPLAGFHENYKQTKHAAFIELCASLGAKEICIESAEINEQTLDVNADIKAPIAKLGLGINVRENHETGQKIAFKFSEANRNIKDFDSAWLYSEPSWMSLNNLRRNNHLSDLGAEFTCLDDMGINANLTSKLLGVGINIGGKFKEMTKIRLSYSLTFWE